LEGLYQFDGNLKDKTGKLAEAVSTHGTGTSSYRAYIRLRGKEKEILLIAVRIFETA
jgi:hypothetical protein